MGCTESGSCRPAGSPPLEDRLISYLVEKDALPEGIAAALGHIDEGETEEPATVRRNGKVLAGVLSLERLAVAGVEVVVLPIEIRPMLVALCRCHRAVLQAIVARPLSHPADVEAHY